MWLKKKEAFEINLFAQLFFGFSDYYSFFLTTTQKSLSYTKRKFFPKIINYTQILFTYTQEFKIDVKFGEKKRSKIINSM